MNRFSKQYIEARNALIARRNTVTAAAIAVACGVFSVSSAAQVVGLHVASKHNEVGMNNVNPGIYYRAASGITGGVYYNSEQRVSVYGGYTFETRRWHGFSAAATLGAVSGYNSSVIPLAVGSVAYHFGASAVRVGIIPNPWGPSAAHLMLETAWQ